MICDAYFPMSWIYNTDGVLVGDLFLHCVFDIGNPSALALAELEAQQHHHGVLTATVYTEEPFIVNHEPLKIPTPWKLQLCEWVHTCEPRNAKYAGGSNAKPIDPKSKILGLVEQLHRRAYTFFAPYTCFAAGEFIYDKAQDNLGIPTFSTLVSPFSAYTEGLYLSYADRRVSMQCSEPLLKEAVALYRKSRTASDFFKQYIDESLGKLNTVRRVPDVDERKMEIANAALLRQMSTMDSNNQDACHQLMNNAVQLYKVNVNTTGGVDIRQLTIKEPVQLNAELFDDVIIVGEGLRRGTRVKVGEKTNRLRIGTVDTHALQGYYKTADGNGSCLAMVDFVGKPKLSQFNMTAAVPSDGYLKALVNMGTVDKTHLNMAIPYIAQCSSMLDLHEVGEHCASVRMEFGLQPAESIVLSAAPCYRYGMIVTKPKCGVVLRNALPQTKHENKFSMSDRHLTFYIPTFSRPHTIYVDTTDVTSGRHIISFVDSEYLCGISRLRRDLSGYKMAEVYPQFLQEIRDRLRAISVANIYADDEHVYFAEKPRELAQVAIKVRTTTSILLSSALHVLINAIKPIKTLILVELENAAPNAEVHICGDIETLRIYAGEHRQYTYYLHGKVKNIIKETQGYSRDGHVVLAPAYANSVTVHVRPGANINTISSSGTETVFYCSNDCSDTMNFGRLTPRMAGNVSALNTRFVLCDSKMDGAVNLIPDVT